MKWISGMMLGACLSTAAVWMARAQAVQPVEVVRVIDGDTLDIKEQGRTLRMRLRCVDAPEESQGAYGAQATETLRTLLPTGSIVTLRNEGDGGWGRIAATVIRNGTDINQEMVRRGQAYAYGKYMGRCDRQTYQHLENEARANKSGVWNVPNGIEKPWDYRRK
jgi:endonuclease YncB( thermonuclease family)